MEIEFKFLVPADRLKSVQKAMRASPVTRTHLQARYFDTADRLLAQRHVALRLRKEGRDWVQTAKAMGQGPLHRLEHNVKLGAVALGELPALDVRRHDNTDVGAVLDEVLDGRASDLQEIFSTDIRRITRNVRLGRSVIELALDLGKVEAPANASGMPRVSNVCELELELIEGDVADLVTVAREWSQSHGLWLSTLSKAQRGERLFAAQGDAPVVKAARPTWPKRLGNGSEVQRIVIHACLAHVLPNASEIAAGEDDEEVVHQLRVGIRRLRTALRELDDQDPGRLDPAWEVWLVEAFRALGESRDLDVLARTLPPRMRAAGGPSMDFHFADGPAHTPPEAVRTQTFQKTLVDLIGFAAKAFEPGDLAVPPARARALIGKHLGKLHRQVVRDGKRFDTLPLEEQHRVRKRLKRLRYLAEFVAPLFKEKGVARYVEDLVPAQDALGEFNDDAVAIAACRHAAAKDPRAWFAVGWISAMQSERVSACMRALANLGKSPRFWEKGS